MSKVEELRRQGTPIFVENSGTRVSQNTGLKDLTSANKGAEEYKSNYDIGEAQEKAKYDDAGNKVDNEREALSLIDAHMERKKKEMEEYFEKEDAEKELKEAIDDTDETDSPSETITEDTTVEEENDDYSIEPKEEVMDEFEKEMEEEFNEEMTEDAPVNNYNEERELTPELKDKYDEAESIADNLLSNIDDDDNSFSPENNVLDEEPKKINSKEIKKEIVNDVMSSHPKEEIKLPENISSDIDEDDFAELEESEDGKIVDDDPLDTPEMKELQKDISKKISIVTKKLDISSMSISKKPVSITAALKTAQSDVKCANWALMSSERCVTMSEFSGSEMEKLISAASQRRLTLSNVRELYGLLYKHDINPKKPDTLEAWLKTTSFLDADHLFMAVYAATFGDSNHIPYNCTSKKCGNMWITDNRPIMEMVKFKDEKSKSKFHNILNSTPNYNTNFYKTEIVQISDEYAIGIKVPSIYDVVFEQAALDNEFRSKYSDYITILQYIDAFYLIDAKTQQLFPIEYKKYPTNMNKNTKSKIYTYSKILGKLSTDQYTAILAYMREINSGEDELEYIIPASTCEKCGEEIPESPQSARDLLFTRHQLTALRTI